MSGAWEVVSMDRTAVCWSSIHAHKPSSWLFDASSAQTHPIHLYLSSFSPEKIKQLPLLDLIQHSDGDSGPLLRPCKLWYFMGAWTGLWGRVLTAKCQMPAAPWEDLAAAQPMKVLSVG